MKTAYTKETQCVENYMSMASILSVYVTSCNQRHARDDLQIASGLVE